MLTYPMTTTMHPLRQMDRMAWLQQVLLLLPSRLQMVIDCMKTSIRNWSHHWMLMQEDFRQWRLHSWIQMQHQRRTTTGTTHETTTPTEVNNSTILMQCRRHHSWRHLLQRPHHHLRLRHQPHPVTQRLLPHLCLHIQKQILMLRRSWSNILSR